MERAGVRSRQNCLEIPCRRPCWRGDQQEPSTEDTRWVSGGTRERTLRFQAGHWMAIGLGYRGVLKGDRWWRRARSFSVKVKCQGKEVS